MLGCVSCVRWLCQFDNLRYYGDRSTSCGWRWRPAAGRPVWGRACVAGAGGLMAVLCDDAGRPAGWPVQPATAAMQWCHCILCKKTTCIIVDVWGWDVGLTCFSMDVIIYFFFGWRCSDSFNLKYPKWSQLYRAKIKTQFSWELNFSNVVVRILADLALFIHVQQLTWYSDRYIQCPASVVLYIFHPIVMAHPING